MYKVIFLDDEPITLKMLENAIDWRTCYRLAVALVQIYIQERERPDRPVHILLDLDTTDDATYGTQEKTAYHGYYREHMYHPLFIFDGDADMGRVRSVGSAGYPKDRMYSQVRSSG